MLVGVYPERRNSFEIGDHGLAGRTVRKMREELRARRHLWKSLTRFRALAHLAHLLIRESKKRLGIGCTLTRVAWVEAIFPRSGRNCGRRT